MSLINPGILAILLSIAISATTVWIIFKQKKLPKYFFLLRLSVLAVLLLLIFQPSLSLFEKKSKPYVAALIDTSKSMDFAERLIKIKKFQKSNLPLMKASFDIDFYEFSKNASQLNPGQIQDLKATGALTDISRSISQVSTTKNYDSIFLFSDGINNYTGEINQQPAETPVISFFQEEQQTPKDVSVANIKASDFIFKNIPAEVTAGIFSSGYDGITAAVSLFKNKEIAASKQIVFDKPYKEITFEFVSNKIGVETYNIEITLLPGETLTDNNRRSFTVETIREKIRILYICGQPSPEYYYLRHFLKSNPSIELVSFVILRNPEDVAVVPDEQLSLIPFPQNEIFTRDLFDFDIFILDNFNYARFNIPPQYLPNIKKFVIEKGGGFVMLGGNNAFGKGNYAGTPIEEILPVILDKPEDNPVSGLFKLRFTNFNHPILAIDDEKTDTQKLWNNLPETDGCQALVQKAGSTVIAYHPSLKLRDKNIACIAVQDIGKGKTAALGINTTWRWLFAEESDAKSNNLYSNFWENMIYWLSGSQQTKELRISVLQKNYLPGDDINFKVIVLNQELRKKKPLITITDPLSKITQLQNSRPYSQGWTGSFAPQLPGEYVLSAQIEKGRDLNNTRLVADDRKYVRVDSSISSEDYQLQANPQFLKELSDSTGGIYFYSLDSFPDKEILSLLKKHAKPVLKKQISFAKNPAFYFAILILLLSEWVIRKLKGLI